MRGITILLVALAPLVSSAGAQTNDQSQAASTQTASAGQARIEASAQAAATEQARPPLPDMMSTFEFVTQDWR